MTTDTLDHCRDAVREIFGDRAAFAAPVATVIDRDASARATAIRNLAGCHTTWIDEDGQEIAPPAAFLDTLRRGQLGELTRAEQRMMSELRGGDYRVSPTRPILAGSPSVTEVP